MSRPIEMTVSATASALREVIVFSRVGATCQVEAMAVENGEATKLR
jgi:hypothetical protein